MSPEFHHDDVRQNRLTRKLNTGRYPLILRLVAGPHAFCEGGVIIGRAADGVEVQLGDVDTLQGTEAYLAAHPTPDTW